MQRYYLFRSEGVWGSSPCLTKILTLTNNLCNVTSLNTSKKSIGYCAFNVHSMKQHQLWSPQHNVKFLTEHIVISSQSKISIWLQLTIKLCHNTFNINPSEDSRVTSRVDFPPSAGTGCDVNWGQACPLVGCNKISTWNDGTLSEFIWQYYTFVKEYQLFSSISQYLYVYWWCRACICNTYI